MTTLKQANQSTGTYQLHTSNEGDGWRCIAYRSADKRTRMLTTVRARTEQAAVSEARRNVRVARKAGGL